MTKTTPFIQVRVDKDIYDQLTIAADDLGISTTALINDMLKNAAKAVELANTQIPE